MEELKRVQELRIDESSRRRLIENKDTNEELTARILELQNEFNCMNDSRDFLKAESVRCGLSHVPSQPALLPPYRDPGGMPSRKDKPPDIWDTHGFSGIVFVNPPASSSSPCPQESNPSEHASPHVMSERQNPDTALDPSASQDRQPEIHSTLMREDFQRIMGQTNKDCRLRIFTLTNSLHQQHLLVGRSDSKLRYVLVHNFLRSGGTKGPEAGAMLLIKEVETV